MPKLYDSVIVPVQVIRELSHARTPAQVRQWAENVPSWVTIEAGNPDAFPDLDPGEAAAISIAISTGGQLLVDDREAREAAALLGVTTVGTVGLIADAHLQSLLDFDETIERLEATSFRVRPEIIAIIRSRISELGRGSP